jgi:hypothetical protein
MPACRCEHHAPKGARNAHLRSAQVRVLGRKVSDEYTVPLSLGEFRAAAGISTNRADLRVDAMPVPQSKCGGSSMNLHAYDLGQRIFDAVTENEDEGAGVILTNTTGQA